MLKQLSIVAITLSIFTAWPVAAHHGHHHDPPAPSPSTPPTTTTTAATIAAPPPVVQAPPPVVNAAPPMTLPAFNFQMPIIAPIGTILPTDISGLHAGPFAPKAPDTPLTKEELAALTAPDQRYQYTGVWLPFASDYQGHPEDDAGGSTQPSPTQSNVHQGRVVHTESPPAKPTDATFMPTENADYSKVHDEHLSLHTGAVLVRAGIRPVFVSVDVHGEKHIVRIAGGAIALISAFDGKAVVVNLTDKCCGALVLYVPTKEKLKQHSIGIKTGQIAEVYAPAQEPNSNLVATKIDYHRRLESGSGVILTQCHYVRTLKKFNLLSVLGKNDLNRVLKTAAAIAHVRGH